MPVQGPTVLPGQQQRMLGRDVGCAVVGDQVDQLGVQRQVAVLAELADRDVQPGSGPDLDHRIRGECSELTDPQPGAQQHLHGDPDQEPAVGVGGAKQLAAAASSSACGNGWYWRGRSPGNIGTRGGAWSQPHSSILTKNIRSVPSRCAIVAVVSLVLFCPGRFANQGLYCSM